MTVSRLEQIVHVLVAKPIAWTIYGIWQSAKWACQGAVRFGAWVRVRYIAIRKNKFANETRTA